MEFSRFRDDKVKFDAVGAEVVGLSADTPADNKAWAQELKLPFRLLSDVNPKGKVSQTYGVWDDLWGLSKRATFVIDRQGAIRYADVGGLAIDTKRVLDALQRLSQQSSGRRTPWPG